MDELLSAYPATANQPHLLDETPTVVLEKREEKPSIDVLVMSAISRSRLLKMLIGCTAKKCLDFMDTYILVIKLLMSQHSNTSRATSIVAL